MVVDNNLLGLWRPLVNLMSWYSCFAHGKNFGTKRPKSAVCLSQGGIKSVAIQTLGRGKRRFSLGKGGEMRRSRATVTKKFPLKRTIFFSPSKVTVKCMAKICRCTQRVQRKAIDYSGIISPSEALTIGSLGRLLSHGWGGGIWKSQSSKFYMTIGFPVEGGGSQP